MKVVITGATGFIGRGLSHRLLERRHEVMALTRDVSRARTTLPKAIKVVRWTPGKPGSWMRSLCGTDGVVHLASEPPEKLFLSDDEKAAIVAREKTMLRVLRQAMVECADVPPVLIFASAITYYGERGDEELDETSSVGSGFWAQACAELEEEAFAAAQDGLRTIVLRLGFVLERDGGPLHPLLPLFKYYLGGRYGDPDQWISWIHRRDVSRFILHLLTHDELQGVFNLTAPNPVRAADYYEAIARALGKPSWVRVSAGVMRFMLGDLADLLLISQRVQPQRMVEIGYKHRFSDLDDALGHILSRP